MVSFCGHQKTVYERSKCRRIIERNDQKNQIDVGSDNMRLFRKIDRTADDMVLAFLYLLNNPRYRITFMVEFKNDVIPYRDGIGTFDAFQAKFTLNAAIIECTVFGLDRVPTARGFIDCSLQ